MPTADVKLKPCRVCGHEVAANAKACPSCGAKKPAASKAEAGIDAAANAVFGLGCLLILLVVAVVVIIGVIGAII